MIGICKLVTCEEAIRVTGSISRLAVVGTSCTKYEVGLLIPGLTCPDSCAVVRGRIVTGNGSTPLGNVQLVMDWVDKPVLFGGTIRRKALTRTNSDGFYELKLAVKDDEKQGYYKVKIEVDPNAYFSCGNGEITFDFSTLPADTTITVAHFIPRKAFVELKLLNAEAIQPADYFSSTFSSPISLLESVKGAQPP